MNSNRLILFREVCQELSLQSGEGVSSVDWFTISRFGRLSEELLREFKEEIYWPAASANRTLSGYLIREFQEQVYWNIISETKKLSNDFLTEFEEKISWDIYLQNHEVDFEMLKSLIVKSTHSSTADFKTEHLTEFQKLRIKKILDLKYLFTK